MKKALLLSLVFLLVATSIVLSEVRPLQTPKYNSQFFIENKGQYDSQVKYLARLGGLNYWITNTGVTYDYYQIEREVSLDPLPPAPTDKEPFIDMFVTKLFTYSKLLNYYNGVFYEN
jgi:hypothetical protein